MLDSDLSRNVYCVLGMPIDAIEMSDVLRNIVAAAASKKMLFISTPNLNFLVNVQSDPAFRESLLLSDLCTADGMPVVWVARFVGVPIKNRVAGSDMFDALKARRNYENPLKVFLFGGTEGVAEAACRALNAQQGGVYCIGSLYPGFGSVVELSHDHVIDKINSSGADFLVVSLGAQKGQLWLQRNHDRLRIPVRAHLGAVISFQAATIKRAPAIIRKFAFEWLWRIKEEPYLWRRYWMDGRMLLRLLLTRVVPLVILTWWLQLSNKRDGEDLVIVQTHDDRSVTLSFSGHATVRHIDKVIPVFSDAIACNKQIIIDLSSTRAIDARFLGLLLMLRKKLKSVDSKPILVGLSRKLKELFRLNGVEFLLLADKVE